MEPIRFTAILVKPTEQGTWTYIVLPFKVEEVFGTRGQVKVKGTVNDIVFQSTLFPRGDGTHYLVVNKTLRDMIRATTGDQVVVVLEKDETIRTVEIPDSLMQALEEDEEAKMAFESLPPSHKKEYAQYISEAKKDDTVRRRLMNAIAMLKKKKRLKE